MLKHEARHVPFQWPVHVISSEDIPLESWVFTLYGQHQWKKFIEALPIDRILKILKEKYEHFLREESHQDWLGYTLANDRKVHFNCPKAHLRIPTNARFLKRQHWLYYKQRRGGFIRTNSSSLRRHIVWQKTCLKICFKAKTTDVPESSSKTDTGQILN